MDEWLFLMLLILFTIKIDDFLLKKLYFLLDVYFYYLSRTSKNSGQALLVIFRLGWRTSIYRENEQKEEEIVN
jgi:hypothetical protein